jgi:hypothetical protein
MPTIRITLRAVGTACVVLPVAFFYWDQLEESTGSTIKSCLVVGLALMFGIVDMNDMSGQPEGHHDHND